MMVDKITKKFQLWIVGGCCCVFVGIRIIRILELQNEYPKRNAEIH